MQANISRGVVMVETRVRSEYRRVCSGRGREKREWTASLEQNPRPDRGKARGGGGEDEVPMGEIGETGKKRRLYKVRHPTMRKMQAEPI